MTPHVLPGSGGLCPCRIPPSSSTSKLINLDVGLSPLRGGPAHSSHGRNLCICQIMREPAGLERARCVSALTFYIAIMKSLPKINAACVMSHIFCLEGGKCNRRHSLGSASLFVMVTGRPVVSSGIFWPRKDWNKHHKYPRKCSAGDISFIHLDKSHLASFNFLSFLWFLCFPWWQSCQITCDNEDS